MPQAAVSEPHAAVRREALSCLAQVLANVQALPPSDAKLISECAPAYSCCNLVEVLTRPGVLSISALAISTTASDLTAAFVTVLAMSMQMQLTNNFRNSRQCQ